MKAKDTVMGLEQIGDIGCEFQKDILETGEIGKFGRAISQAKDKISF